MHKKLTLVLILIIPLVISGGTFFIRRNSLMDGYNHGWPVTYYIEPYGNDVSCFPNPELKNTFCSKQNTTNTSGLKIDYPNFFADYFIWLCVVSGFSQIIFILKKK